MDDLIYILFLLAWAGFAFYRNSMKKKKADANQGTVVEKPVERKSAGTLLEEILMGEEIAEPEVQKPVYGHFEIPVDPNRRSSFEEEYDLLGIESIEELVPEGGDSSSQKRKILLDEPDSETGEHSIDFDLRTAVVYSEILNRRYF